MNSNKLLLPIAIVLATFLSSVFAGCDTVNTENQDGQGTITLQFKTVTGSSQKAVSSDNTIMENDSVTIEGTNGSLHIDDIRFIVEKFKFEVEDDGCEDADNEEGPDCEEFEAEPFFVDLPLNEDTLSLANDQIEPGLYKEIEFEVEDLDFEDEDEDEEVQEQQEHQALADSIRAVYPDWPDEASMVIRGTFTSNDDSTKSFKVFAKAEIEIEREFEPPLEVTEENMEQVVSVRINPARWLRQEDGSVIDLSKYDWNEHHELLEFSAEFEDGIEDIEVEEEDLDD